MTKSGTGVLTLSGVNTFSGATNINSGVVLVQNTAALGSVAGGTAVASGAELRIAGGSSVGAEPLTLNGAGTSGAGALRVVSGTTSWAGGITLASAAGIGVDAGQLTLGGPINLSRTRSLSPARERRRATVLSAAAVHLAKSGAGTLILTAANTFTGATAINAGAINVRNGAAFGATGAGAVTVVGGAAILLNYPGGVNVGNKAITLNGDGIGGAGAIDSIVGNHSWTGNVTLASDTTIAVEADSLTISGTIGETGGARTLTKTRSRYTRIWRK